MDTRYTSNAGRLLWTAAKIMHNHSEQDETIEVLEPLECPKSKLCVHCGDNMNALTNTIRLTMLEINEIQEKNRERRHRELVELFEKFLGGNQINSPDISNNVKVESLFKDYSKNNLEFEGNASETIMQTKIAKNVQNSHEISFVTRKRKLASINGTPIKKSTNPKTQAVETNSPTENKNTISQRDELVAMRHEMLAMQRRKMEDRERKKRESSKI